MRIIIEIEGEVVTVRTEPTEKRQAEYPSDTPPPEVLRAAAALGATSAGPAPTEVELERLGGELPPVAIEALAEAVDAGSGPFAPPGMTVQDGEEQVGEIDEEPSSRQGS